MPSASFDVIVVGAGSAGCALANRLSTDPARRVALIEAGGSDDHIDIHTPNRYFSLWRTNVDWQDESVPQRGTAGRSHYMPRGRVLGGTSSINGMVYLRGAASDYDGWEASGCTGWGWQEVRGDFEAIERWLRPKVLDPLNELSQTIVEAAVQAGLPRRSTFDDGILEGAGYNKSTIVDGRRFSANRAFLEPVRNRENLTVITGSEVLSLAIEGDRATGVVAVADGATSPETLRAREVVLCAGAFNSPRILLHSGIGPAAHLREVGIDVVADLPVGENLIDHLLIGIVFTSNRPISELNSLCTEACCFARSTPDRSDCDMEISFATKPHFAPESTDDLPRYTIIPGITKPRSRGTVRLTGPDPRSRLAIDPNYFDDPYDMQAMIAAVRSSRRIGAQPALESWNSGEYFPGVDVDSDEAIADYVCTYVSTWFHPVGTCRMGTGPDSVADPTLQVRGIRGLRVADASIMPDIVGVNTNAASTMIGWKAGQYL
jgi:choline dehydrogenase